MKSKMTLIALFALFFTPMLLAVLLHSEWVDWRAAPEKAHGELVSPVAHTVNLYHRSRRWAISACRTPTATREVWTIYSAAGNWHTSRPTSVSPSAWKQQD